MYIFYIEKLKYPYHENVQHEFYAHLTFYISKSTKVKYLLILFLSDIASTEVVHCNKKCEIFHTLVIYSITK